MTNKVIHQILAISILSVSSVANAGLIDRGNGMIYDDVLDVTWLQDTNLAVTSGYLKADQKGAMNFLVAKEWAEQLTFGGYNDWRLPTITLNASQTYPLFSELIYMFHVNLGNNCFDPDICTPLKTSFVDINSGDTISFFNVNNNIDNYWTDTEDALNSSHAYSYNKEANGNEVAHFNYFQGAWAVRNGDVLHVPEPTTIGLFGVALIALRQRWKNKHIN
ncbi:PEP-CTERM sorting domain-containing protein [Thalassotalea marina]|nr:PEP-CTERM sorting domain-containing protein [Thalassotalea marina]